VRAAVARHDTVLSELRDVAFQGATLTFEHDLAIDLGNRQVQVRFLGRGNTAGDAVAVLPKERIVAAGDLVVAPLPYVYDGYPSEWVGTLERLLDQDPAIVVPGHGPVQRDHAYVLLEHDLLKGAVDQLDAELVRIGPALAHTVDEVKGGVDLSPFRSRFAGSDRELGAAFDEMAANLVQEAFKEASLR
jgi:glyoxylase-like metal-dependent hydrolase (beta-lactamase superfamily II)